MSKEIALYIHWPFCKSKCPYCDFNSHVGRYDYDVWEKAYIKEIEYFQRDINKKEISSIFFGGGTPSLMSPNLLENIIDFLYSNFTVQDDVEITMEANPTSYEYNKFKDFRNAGINRLSIGVQSFNDKDLKFLGREHSLSEAKEALASAATLFERFSFDLIYALPNQTIDDWRSQLREALKYTKGHISLYQLIIEKGTKFYSDYRKKRFQLPDDELSRELYDVTQEILSKNNMRAYEVSNYAIKGQESKHNLTYWRYQDYLGIGPGAHSRIDGKSIVMAYSPNEWLERVNNHGNGIKENLVLTDYEKFSEMIMMNLRIFEPIYIANILAKTGISIPKDKLAHLRENELLEYQDNEWFKITNKGIRMLDSVVRYLL